MAFVYLPNHAAQASVTPDADQTVPSATGVEAQETTLKEMKKPTVVGIYGISGSGKTHLLNQLRQELQQEPYEFFDGSEAIATLVPGGLDAFKEANAQGKAHWRELAIREIAQRCATSDHTGVVTGHSMLWSENGKMRGEKIWTQGDASTYTHIFYMDVAADVVAQRRGNDWKRLRKPVPSDQLAKWQDAEKQSLRHLCHTHGIVFGLIPASPSPLHGIKLLLRNICQRKETDHRSGVEREVDQFVLNQGQVETMLVLDADKTLAAVDTGDLFWRKLPGGQPSLAEEEAHVLKRLFSGPLAYSSNAFLRAALLYEEVVGEGEFDRLCKGIADEVIVHPEFVSLLQGLAQHRHIGAVVLTCGLRLVWEKVLKREGLSEFVKVIGNGRVGNGYIMTPTFKAAAVTRLQNEHQACVWAFGDSPMDLPMLKEANHAVIVVGEERSRSSTMEAALTNAIKNDGLRACQALLPASVKPRLDPTKLPIIQLAGSDFMEKVISQRQPGLLRILHATSKHAAKLLMTPMRDATVAGPALREAHRQVGRYLATEYIAAILGIEEYPTLHVQGHQATGYRLKNEQETVIVALMRGGEPMAFGVNDAFPRAMFLHASCPDDIKLHHLREKQTVVLVDSVVNSGKTAAEFVQYVRKLKPDIGVAIVAGVVQSKVISEGNVVRKAIICRGDVDLIALRLSENKFTGRGTTDTGNRLFNTTYLP
ncbi:hypothetical protein PG999_005559 [Apiospora kogelbergensis]|uniref:Phosphoribosyltransferase domain-containing protein n=1 Tax=Apiospora kogelbergensis TaxID=1337665 RepID=A0AAW0R2F8_9PEZI